MTETSGQGSARPGDRMGGHLLYGTCSHSATIDGLGWVELGGLRGGMGQVWGARLWPGRSYGVIFIPPTPGTVRGVTRAAQGLGDVTQLVERAGDRQVLCAGACGADAAA